MTNQVTSPEIPGREARASGFLSDLPDAQADRLLSESIRLDVPPGGVVYRDGDTAQCFVVVRGLLRSFMNSPDGRQINFRYGKAGDVIGLASVIGVSPPLTVQAMSSTSVIAVRVNTLRQMLATDPMVARACAEELTRQLRRALADVAESAFMTVRQKLARQLLDLAVHSAGSELVVKASHQELADAIASSREVISRTLREMREDGLIGTGPDRGIVLRDAAGLAREAEGQAASEDGRTGPAR
jgi:CRP/FNR family cyclic AMP-dependent transcriptional regulator